MQYKRITKRKIIVKSYAFLTEVEGDFFEWERAISGYVVQQTKIEDVYTIIDKLGQGSFGYVVLAEPKKIKPQVLKSDNHHEDVVVVGEPQGRLKCKVSIVVVDESSQPQPEVSRKINIEESKGDEGI